MGIKRYQKVLSGPGSLLLGGTPPGMWRVEGGNIRRQTWADLPRFYWGGLVYSRTNKTLEAVNM